MVRILKKESSGMVTKTKGSGNLLKKVENLLIGKSLDPTDHRAFHSISLIALFAWVGLDADGLSPSAYGPEEAFRALGSHNYLCILVALSAAITVLVISASYTQLNELFPAGGGGYLVASKLLSPRAGDRVWAGCFFSCSVPIACVRAPIPGSRR